MSGGIKVRRECEGCHERETCWATGARWLCAACWLAAFGRNP